jgi:hypothetical protein
VILSKFIANLYIFGAKFAKDCLPLKALVLGLPKYWCGLAPYLSKYWKYIEED